MQHHDRRPAAAVRSAVAGMLVLMLTAAASSSTSGDPVRDATILDRTEFDAEVLASWWTEDVFLLGGYGGTVGNEALCLEQYELALDPHENEVDVKFMERRVIETRIAGDRQADRVWRTGSRTSPLARAVENGKSLPDMSDPEQVYFIADGHSFRYVPAERTMTLLANPARVGFAGQEHLFHAVASRFGEAARGNLRPCVREAEQLETADADDSLVMAWQCPDGVQYRAVIGLDPKPHLREWWRIHDVSDDPSYADHELGAWQTVADIWQGTDWNDYAAGMLPERGLSVRVVDLGDGRIGGNVAVLTRHTWSVDGSESDIEAMTYRAHLRDGLRLHDERWPASGRIGSDSLDSDGQSHQLNDPLDGSDGWPLHRIDELLEDAGRTDHPVRSADEASRPADGDGHASNGRGVPVGYTVGVIVLFIAVGAMVYAAVRSSR